jgi:hypothetical protein
VALAATHLHAFDRTEYYSMLDIVFVVAILALAAVVVLVARGVEKL